jgi:hypothetical protein
MTKEGVAILFKGNRYELTVTLARMGILPFFWIACVVVYCWGIRYFGTATTGGFLFQFLAIDIGARRARDHRYGGHRLRGSCVFVWVDFRETTLRAGAILGVCTGLASKFLALVYLPAAIAIAMAFYYFIERPKMGDLCIPLP